MGMVSERVVAAGQELAVMRAFFDRVAATHGEYRPETCDFTFGNPHEMPLPGLVAALKTNAEPLREVWFAYQTSRPEACEAIAAGLSRELGLAFEPADIVIPVPGWFCYPPMLRVANLVPVRAALEPERFGLDLAAIDAAITPRTRMVVVNTPHNPTGRIYDDGTLKALAALLERASARIGRRVF